MNMSLVLEIGNPWLKIVLFRGALGTTVVKAMGSFNSPGAGEEVIAQNIAQFLKEQGVQKPQSIIICFSRNAVTLRNLRIPSANPNEIDDMIKLHVGRQVPYAKEEIINGYRTIGKDTMGYAKVMLAIVHRESVRKIFRILEKAGLYSDRMELSSDGVFSWLCRALKVGELKSGEAFILLDIDGNFTDFIVSSPEHVLFSRVITLGAEQLADEAKWPKFIGEMKQTLVISQGEEVLQKPSRIFVTGAGAALKKLSSTIETEFNLPVQIVEPMSHLPVAKDLAKKPADLLITSSFSALLGLGLDAVKKKISFVLPEAQIRRTLHERTREVVFFGTSAMYLILVMCGIYFEKIHNKQTYLDVLGARYEKIAAQSEDLGEKVERLKKIKSKLDTRSVALNYFYEVSRLLPGEITVTSIVFQKDERLDLKGRAVEMSDIFKFVTTLGNSAYFKDVQSRYTTRKKIKNVDLNEFEISCPFRSEKSAKDKAKKVSTKASGGGE
jgi:Tfp pilus assembly PilM family ATPase/Tfp pilus assembly protein PilN